MWARFLLICVFELLLFTNVNGQDNNNDEDTSLVKLLSTQEQKLLKGYNHEHLQKIENNINGGGFVGDEVPSNSPKAELHSSKMDTSNTENGKQLFSFSNLTQHDVKNSKNIEQISQNPYLDPKDEKDDNAQKRERYEETVGNPNPKPEFFKQLENNYNLNEVENTLEMNEGDAGKENSSKVGDWQEMKEIDIENPQQIKNLQSKQEINSNVPEDFDKGIPIISEAMKIPKSTELSQLFRVNNSDDITGHFFKDSQGVNKFIFSEQRDIQPVDIDSKHSNPLDQINLQPVDIDPNQSSEDEEKRLRVRLNFLKSKLRQKQKPSLLNNYDNNEIPVGLSQTTPTADAKPKYKMRLLPNLTNYTAADPLLEKNRPDDSMTFKNLTNIVKPIPTLDSILHKETFAFSYDTTSPFGPPSWQILNPEWTCNGRKQSPINIDNNFIMDNQIIKNVRIKITPLNSPLTGVMKNNGHAPTLSLSSDIAVKLIGGTLNNDYYLKQMHFHFGCDSKTGSEHHIDGVGYPLEVHLVFWDNSTFISFPDAAKADRGIAVLSVLYQLETQTFIDMKNTPMSQVTQVLRHIEEEGDEIAVTEEFNFRLERLLPNVMSPDSVDRFFIYEGSLSTPGCYESVTWVVFATHPVVTENQLEIFRKMKSTKVSDGNKMCNNYRPTQKKNGRRIYSNIV